MTKITFKITNQEQSVVLDVDLASVGTILGLKEKLAQKTDTTSSNVKLIHKGNLHIYIRQNSQG